MKTSPDPQYRHRFPVEIISHAVWLYHVFSLSLRDVELILAQRGVFVSYETVRRWCEKFGESFALWRAVDQNGVVLDVLVQKRRDGKAAKRFFKRLLKGLQYVPRVIVTDKLKSYGVAKRAMLPTIEHRQSRYLNNRVENSHRPTRRRERQMQRFKSSRQAQGFLSAHAFIHGHFHPRRHLMKASEYRVARAKAFKIWTQETCAKEAA
jgi:putative transposase